MDEYKRLFEEEFKQFIILLSKRDGEMLISRYKRKNLPEFVRLACIAMTFGYKRMFMKIAATVERHMDEFLKGMDILNGNFALLEKWVNDFIDGIRLEGAQDIAREFWEERKSTFDTDNFTVEQLK